MSQIADDIIKVVTDRPGVTTAEIYAACPGVLESSIRSAITTSVTNGLLEIRKVERMNHHYLPDPEKAGQLDVCTRVMRGKWL